MVGCKFAAPRDFVEPMIPFDMARSLVGGGLLHAEAFARTDLSCKMHLPASPQCENDRRARPAQNQNAFSQCHVLFASFCIVAVVIPRILPGVAALRDSVARHGMSGFQKAMLMPFIARRLCRGGLLHAASARTGSCFVLMHLSRKTHLPASPQCENDRRARLRLHHFASLLL